MVSKILIVEDMMIVARDIQAIIEKHGYETCAIVNSGEDAISKTEELKPHVILMDINLSGKMDGIEAAAVINKQYATPIIFMTAYSNNDYFERAKATGPYSYIIKPFVEQDLLNQIEMALYKSKAELEKREVLQRLEESQKRYRELFENMHSGAIVLAVCEKDNKLSFIIKEINRAARNMVCTIVSNFKDADLLQAFPELAGIEKYIEKIWVTKQSEKFSIKQEQGVDFVRWFDCNGYIAPSSENINLIIEDVTEKIKYQEAMRNQSFRDKLTGLYNRAYFDEQAERLDTHRQLPMSVIIADANGLKLVNDAFGHTQGDQYLIQISQTLKQCLRKEDVICRWGGDEYAILLPNTSKETVACLIDRIKGAAATVEPNPICLSVSFGSATKQSSEESLQDVFLQAEKEMYRNKLLESNEYRKTILSFLTKKLQEQCQSVEQHNWRLQILGIHLAERLNLDAEDTGKLISAIALHDLGIVALTKESSGNLYNRTEEQEVVFQKHTETGYHISSGFKDYVNIAPIVLSHHENWDGSGYPQRLKGLEIPQLARILRVIDEYDSLINGINREMETHQEAIESLKRGAGIYFDEAIVEEFLQLDFTQYPFKI